ncbi:MAG: NAD(+)/NADH kinase [Planctomycetota bacterium]
MPKAALRVIVVGDERKGATKALLQRHSAWLQEQGCQVATITDREAPLCDIAADYVVVFGGDGSLLGAARRMGHGQKPTLGINCGRLGFLTSFEHEQAGEALRRLVAGQLIEERRLMMQCSVVAGDGDPSTPVLFLNDAVISRATVAGIVTVRVSRGSVELATYRGDGLIAATASGSTAYSMAAGGPVLSPDLEAIVLTPLASHTLSARPLVLPVGDGVDIEVVETGSRQKAACQVDGQVQLQVPVGGRVVLRPARVAFRHLVPAAHHFFDVLHAKFGFADLPAARGS